jgi:hypothetical protein
MDNEAILALCHSCAYPLACEVEREGERLGSLAFFDDESASSTYGERIEHCPRCGLRLALHNLLPRRPLQGGKPTDNLREDRLRPGAS